MEQYYSLKMKRSLNPYKNNLLYMLKTSQFGQTKHQVCTKLVVWAALEAEGLGASLQHYNPLIDDEVKKEWNIPGNWKLIAQMPFGNPTSPPGEKEFQPLEIV